ncbi:MAG: hypothetical protein PHI40_07420 [Caldisericia bacterium]|nr:hypothetical protein [Caldisericia bacterium]MDD4615212.1 hypothetical protein [Caldisericia bacterium]
MKLQKWIVTTFCLIGIMTSFLFMLYGYHQYDFWKSQSKGLCIHLFEYYDAKGDYLATRVAKEPLENSNDRHEVAYHCLVKQDNERRYLTIASFRWNLLDLPEETYTMKEKWTPTGIEYDIKDICVKLKQTQFFANISRTSQTEPED